MRAAITPDAIRQARSLVRHYQKLGRIEAIDNIASAIEAAQSAIPLLQRHRAAPPPYPRLARDEIGWLKQGRYWFVYGIAPPREIVAIFHDTANIVGRSRSP